MYMLVSVMDQQGLLEEGWKNTEEGIMDRNVLRVVFERIPYVLVVLCVKYAFHSSIPFLPPPSLLRSPPLPPTSFYHPNLAFLCLSTLSAAAHSVVYSCPRLLAFAQHLKSSNHTLENYVIDIDFKKAKMSLPNICEPMWFHNSYC